MHSIVWNIYENEKRELPLFRLHKVINETKTCLLAICLLFIYTLHIEQQLYESRLFELFKKQKPDVTF